MAEDDQTTVAATRASRKRDVSFTDMDDVDNTGENDVEALLKECEKILGVLLKHEDADAFLEPVSRRDYPDYVKIIEQPMDLGTIKKRMKQGTVKTPREFAALVRLVWKNCYTYNRDSAPVVQNAKKLERLFEELYGKLDPQGARGKDELGPRHAGEIPTPLLADRPAVRKVGRPKKNVATATGKAPREMTLQEKRLLSVMITRLNEKGMKEMLEILSEDMPALKQLAIPGREWECSIDLHSFDSYMLWRLDAHCRISLAVTDADDAEIQETAEKKAVEAANAAAQDTGDDAAAQDSVDDAADNDYRE